MLKTAHGITAKTTGKSSPPGGIISTYSSINAEIFSITWSPDGTRLAAANGGQLHIWDPNTGDSVSVYEPIATDANGASFFGGLAIAWSPDSIHLALSGSFAKFSQTIQLYETPAIQVVDVKTGLSQVSYLGHNHPINTIAWSSDGKRIASAGEDSTVQIWDAFNGQTLSVYRGQTPKCKNGVQILKWFPDGKHIISTTRNVYMNGLLKIWETDTGKTILTYASQQAVVSGLAQSPDGRYIASQDMEIEANSSTNFIPSIHVWNAQTGLTERVYRHDGRAIAWSPDGKYIAAAANKDVRIWSPHSGETILIYRGHFGQVLAVAWSPDSKRMASGGEDKTVQVWSVQ